GLRTGVHDDRPDRRFAQWVVAASHARTATRRTDRRRRLWTGVGGRDRAERAARLTMTHLVRGLLLLAVAGLIAKLLVSGQIALYMSPALNPLSGCAGVVLAGMGVFELWSGARATAAVGARAHGSL